MGGGKTRGRGEGERTSHARTGARTRHHKGEEQGQRQRHDGAAGGNTDAGASDGKVAAARHGTRPVTADGSVRARKGRCTRRAPLGPTHVPRVRALGTAG